MRNGGELSDLEHLLTKTEYTRYLQIADTSIPRLFCPFKQHYIELKQVQDHEKWWRIE